MGNHLPVALQLEHLPTIEGPVEQVGELPGGLGGSDTCHQKSDYLILPSQAHILTVWRSASRTRALPADGKQAAPQRRCIPGRTTPPAPATPMAPPVAFCYAGSMTQPVRLS